MLKRFASLLAAAAVLQAAPAIAADPTLLLNDSFEGLPHFV
jgi:hypothetical protein